MDEDVAETAHLLPRDLWAEGLMFGTDSTCELREDLESADARVRDQGRLRERFMGGLITCGSRVLLDFPDAFFS